jgi:hypothetical protein
VIRHFHESESCKVLGCTAAALPWGRSGTHCCRSPRVPLEGRRLVIILLKRSPKADKKHLVVEARCLDIMSDVASGGGRQLHIFYAVLPHRLCFILVVDCVYSMPSFLILCVSSTEGLCYPSRIFSVIFRYSASA